LVILVAKLDLAAHEQHFRNNLNPKFTRSVAMDFYFAAEQWVRFDVLDVDDEGGTWKEQDQIGYLVSLIGIAVPGEDKRSREKKLPIETRSSLGRKL
jgi:hypothetical protein